MDNPPVEVRARSNKYFPDSDVVSALPSFYLIIQTYKQSIRETSGSIETDKQMFKLMDQA